MTEQLQKVIDCLNDAWKRDPLAVRSLLINVVPCNSELADHPTIPVLGLEEGFTVGTLGFLNGVLDSLGIGKVAAKWSDDTDEYRRARFVGFCEYIPAESKPK